MGCFFFQKRKSKKSIQFTIVNTAFHVWKLLELRMNLSSYAARKKFTSQFFIEMKAKYDNRNNLPQGNLRYRFTVQEYLLIFLACAQPIGEDFNKLLLSCIVSLCYQLMLLCKGFSCVTRNILLYSVLSKE